MGSKGYFGSGDSIMALIFEIDKSFIKYSSKVTYCHFGVKWRQKKLKFCMEANFGSGNTNMSFIFEIDKFFINYS